MHSMKMILAAAVFAGGLWMATAGAQEVEAVEAPAAAIAVVDAYLEQLADGNVDGAVLLVDMPAIRSYLLEARLTDLKSKNPGLTEGDLTQISRQLELNELNPARLQAILKAMLGASQLDDAEWSVARYVKLPDGPLSGEESYMAMVDVVRGGEARGMAVPVRRNGEEWLVAMDMLEAMSARNPRNILPVPPTVEAPQEVKDIVEAFWRLWREDTPEATYELFNDEFKRGKSLSAYLGEVLELTKRIGTVQDWQIVHVRSLNAKQLALGVNVKGSLGESETIMICQQMDDGSWAPAYASFTPPNLRQPRPAAPPAEMPNLLGIPTPQPALPAAPSLGGGLGGMGTSGKSSVDPGKGPSSNFDSGLDSGRTP